MSLQITKSVLPNRTATANSKAQHSGAQIKIKLIACDDTFTPKLHCSKSAHNIVSEPVFNTLSIGASPVLRNYSCAARFLYKVKVMIFYVFLSSYGWLYSN